MATLEERILGEKAHNYCSSSEDEGEESDSERKGGSSSKAPAPAPPPPPPDAWSGTATNTGPKGVLNDWQRFKQLEAEARGELERERVALAKKLTLTCASSRQEAENKKRDELRDELLDDDEEVLLEYRRRRMREMLARAGRLPRFGELVHLENGQAFLDAVDKEEDGATTVVVHLYEDAVEACRAMNGCLVALAAAHPRTKFCKLSASAAGVSKRFRASGVPALLVYKGGQVIANFVRLGDVFGEDFYATDVERFLVEHGLLLDESFTPRIVAAAQRKDDDDSDVSLD